MPNPGKSTPDKLPPVIIGGGLSEPQNQGPDRRFSPQTARIVACLVIAAGLFFAILSRWTCDDAYISFRYGRNLVEGQGLVFNPGERVEGYTNFLWTLWAAFGLWLGVAAETWAHLWSISAYGGSILLLVKLHQRFSDLLQSGLKGLPIAALGAALHPDWQVYATSGLETSLFTFLLIGGFTIVVLRPSSALSAACAGMIMGAAFLTRQDAVIPAFLMGLYVLFSFRDGLRSAVFFSAGFSVLAAPFLLWRLSYYGQLLPNTYYAKSANLTWYSQGWHYLSIYFWRYWALLGALPLLLAGLGRWKRRGPLFGPALLAASIALAYSLYVMRVGGDFMFARMLIPATPFFLILFELGLLAGGSFLRLPAAAVLTLVLILGLALSPTPVTADVWYHGIANEWMFYSPQRVAAIEDRATILKAFLEDLPVRIAYLGAEARLAYQARVPVVIDCYGLTDENIAHQKLEQRRRVGHEKLPTPQYLIRQRKVHLMFNLGAIEELDLESAIPIERIRLGGVEGLILHWDPSLLRLLKERGAQFEDFPARLDQYLEGAAGLAPDQIARDYQRFRLFYFEHVADRAREVRFEEAMGGA